MIQRYNSTIKHHYKTHFDTHPHPDRRGKNSSCVSKNKLSENIILPSKTGKNSVKPKKSKVAYKKIEAVKILERLETEIVRGLHPGNPWIVPRTFRDDTANGLTSCIVAYLKLKGAFVSRLNNTGIYDKRLNRYRPGTSRKGLPDVVCTYQGKSIMIEVKTGRDKMSEHQERIRNEQIRSGGLWFTAHNFTEVKEWIDRL